MLTPSGSKDEEHGIVPSLKPQEKTEDIPQQAEAKRPFITQLLLALIPRRWTYSKERPLPLSQPPRHVFRLSDGIAFTHCFSLLWACATGRGVIEADFSPLPNSLSVKAKLATFQDTFRKGTCGKGKESKISSFVLLYTIIYCFRWELSVGLGFCLLSNVTTIFQVFLYRAIIDYLLPLYHWAGPGSVQGHDYGEGIGLLFGAASVIFLGGLFKARSAFAMDLVGGQTRTLLATGIASKALETSQWAFHEADNEASSDEPDQGAKQHSSLIYSFNLESCKH